MRLSRGYRILYNRKWVFCPPTDEIGVTAPETKIVAEAILAALNSI
jgi:hypothetical protein